jgi:hypothetical protein
MLESEYSEIENDQSRQWTRDDQGRQIYVGLTYDETTKLLSLEQATSLEQRRSGHRISSAQMKRKQTLAGKRELARLQRIGIESAGRYVQISIEESKNSSKH